MLEIRVFEMATTRKIYSLSDKKSHVVYVLKQDFTAINF